MQGWKVKGFFVFSIKTNLTMNLYKHKSSSSFLTKWGKHLLCSSHEYLELTKFIPKKMSSCHIRWNLNYLFGVTVAQPKLVKAREEQRSHGQNLRVELRWPGHGGGPGQKDHPLCSLRTKKKEKKEQHWWWNTSKKINFNQSAIASK